jgi:hypothetical protein
MGRSAGDEGRRTGHELDERRRADPQQPHAGISPCEATAGLHAEFAHRLDELLKMVRDAKTRRLTVGEYSSVMALLDVLRTLLGMDA